MKSKEESKIIKFNGTFFFLFFFHGKSHGDAHEKCLR